MTLFNKTISIIGGTGHVGLPLGLALAEKNFKVQLQNFKKLSSISSIRLISYCM